MKERVFLVGAHFPQEERWEKIDSLNELANLAQTAGAQVVEKTIQNLERPNSRLFIGKGKTYQLKKIANSLNIGTFIFDEELTPTQGRNLEEITGRKVIDRTELILDIFAKHARTRAAQIEVELSQLLYRLPRLVGMGTLLSRLGGGIGTRGPGETKLETDRRRIRKRVKYLKEKLKSIETSKIIQSKRRHNFIRVALVGYTNAGKSTIINSLTGAHTRVENKLFSTLDATTRALVFPGREKVLLTDTVGFIRRLPHGIISSFHSTLQEAIEADLRLHVIDIAYPYAELQIMAGNEILDTLGVREKPTIYVFNKIDLDSTLIPHLRHKYPSAVFVSALNGEGIEDLEQRIFEFVKEKKGITGPGE